MKIPGKRSHPNDLRADVYELDCLDIRSAFHGRGVEWWRACCTLSVDERKTR